MEFDWFFPDYVSAKSLQTATDLRNSYAVSQLESCEKSTDHAVFRCRLYTCDKPDAITNCQIRSEGVLLIYLFMNVYESYKFWFWINSR